jgi:hypothetical protein
MALDKRQILKSIVVHTQAGHWDRALDECRQAAILFPDDSHIRYLIAGFSARVSAAPVAAQAGGRPAADAPAAQAIQGTPEAEDSSRAFLDEAVRRRVERQGGGADMATVMASSQRISDVLHAATTMHMDEDVDAMIASARTCLNQDLLFEAMRLCQKIAAQDPENEQMKVLLKEIYRRKGL